MLGRLKFEFGDVVNLVLNRLPPEVWENGKFIDPAFGGGQFLKEIEKRVTINTHERVFGFESNQLRKNYAVNKHKLKGTYDSIPYSSLFEKGLGDMKFDVMVGNPPFNEDPGEARNDAKNSNNSTLYTKFVDLGFAHAHYTSLIIPAGWTIKPSQVKHFVANGLKAVTFLPGSIFDSVKIRSGISLVEFEKNYKGAITITTTDNETYTQKRTDSIQNVSADVKKILYKTSLFNSISNLVVSGDYEIKIGTKGNIDTLVKNDTSFSKTQTTTHQTKVLMYSGGENKSPTYAWSSQKLKSINNYKVTWPKASDRFILGKVRIVPPGEGVSSALYYIECQTQQEADNWLQWFETNLVRFIIKFHKTNDTVNTHNNSMGHIPVCPSVKLTEKEIKKYFDYTDQEYDSIKLN